MFKVTGTLDAKQMAIMFCTELQSKAGVITIHANILNKGFRACSKDKKEM
jgi:hypothetical protein